MNESMAKDKIKLIKEMIDKTKQTAADYWNIFFCWGLVGILGVLGMYILVYLEKYEWIWLNWIGFVALGIVYTLIFTKKWEKKHGLKTYTYSSISHLAIACGVAFMLVGFVFPMMKLYSYGAIPVLISLVAGILAFTEGGILEWNLLKICGIIWWLGAVGMIFVNQDYRGLLFIPLLIVAYFVPFYAARSEFRKNQVQYEN